jgi:hypothetical protein
VHGGDQSFDGGSGGRIIILSSGVDGSSQEDLGVLTIDFPTELGFEAVETLGEPVMSGFTRSVVDEGKLH